MGLLDGLMGHGSEVDPDKLKTHLDGVLYEGETARHAFQVLRDFFVFTNSRIILVDVQGMTGNKVAYRSVPYRAITSFAVETAGSFDMDSELKIWVSGFSTPLQKTLKRGSDVRGIQRALAECISN